MIGAETQRRGWAQASALSFALHAAMLGWLMLPERGLAPPPSAMPPLIELTAIPSPDMPTDATPADAAAESSLRLDSVVPDAIAPRPAVAAVVVQPSGDRLRAQPPATGNDAAHSPAGAVLLPVRPALPSGDGLSVLAGSEAPASAGNSAPGLATGLPGPEAPAGAQPPLADVPRSDAPPTNADPRLTPMFDRIRARLTEPCLLALPRIDADALHLAVLSDSDHNISALSAQLLEGLKADTGRSAALLDPRQCPAIAFARRDPRYPVFPLTVSIETPSVRGGETLRGLVQGASGRSLTLLLIDDNGVVHDLRPFLQVSASGAGFAVPLARVGRARDTQQLLVAVATDQRPRALSDNAGALAGPFFDRLSAEIGQQGLVGVASVLVQ